MDTHPSRAFVRRTLLAFTPLFLFLLLVPVAGYGDNLLSLASPREAAIISGLAKHAARQLPSVVSYKVKKEMRLFVTAYSSTRQETDSDPFTTASGAKVADGVIAHNSLPFGTRVRFPTVFGDKVFVVQDRMNPRYGSSFADLWMPSRQAALQWGVRRIPMQILEPSLSS